MNPEILIAVLSAIPATILSMAALITSIRHSAKLADNAVTIAAAARAAAVVVAAAAEATVVAAEAAAKAAALVAVAADKQRL